MAPTAAADRSVRDRYLAWAMALLVCAQVFHLIAEAIRLPLLLESRVSDAHRIVGWLDLISNLPLLAAASFGIVAFFAGRGERSGWLRQALLLAVFGSAIVFVSNVVELAALEGSYPDGMKLALLSASLGSFALTGGFLLAASAFAGEGADMQTSRRDKALRRAAQVFGAALLLDALSAWAFTLAYSAYPHHDRFTNGLVIEGFGALAVAISLFYAATAFGSTDAGAEDPVRRRERRLFHAAVALGLSFLLFALGEAEHAAGTTAIGYPESSAVAGWIFALFRVGEAAVFLCAARGFRAVSRIGQQG